MEEILHQLRLVVYPIIYKGFYIPGGAGFLPSTGVTTDLGSYSVGQAVNSHSFWGVKNFNTVRLVEKSLGFW